MRSFLPVWRALVTRSGVGGRAATACSNIAASDDSSMSVPPWIGADHGQGRSAIISQGDVEQAPQLVQGAGALAFHVAGRAAQVRGHLINAHVLPVPQDDD